jgi:putative aldouronate transport system substrate-binding protein
MELATKNSWDVSLEAIAGRVGIAFGESWLLGWPLPDGMKLGQEWRPYLIPFADSNTERKYASKAAINGGYVVNVNCANPEALIKMCNLWQDRVISGNHDISIYKNDDNFVYEFLAAFTPTNGPDRNLIANFLINEAIDTGNTNIFTVPEQVRWFEETRDYKNGTTIIEFVRNEGDAPVEYTATNAAILAHLRGGAKLSFGTNHDDDIASQMVNRYAGNYVTYWGRYGADSTHGLTEHMKANNMFKRDQYIGPPTDSMQLYMGQLDSDFHEMAVNIVVGAEDIDFFDIFVEDWYRNGGQAITDEVNAWYASTR